MFWRENHNLSLANRIKGAITSVFIGVEFLNVTFSGFCLVHIEYRLTVLVDIADRQAEQLGDASTSTYAEHEKPAVADGECAGETC